MNSFIFRARFPIPGGAVPLPTSRHEGLLLPHRHQPQLQPGQQGYP